MQTKQIVQASANVIRITNVQKVIFLTVRVVNSGYLKCNMPLEQEVLLVMIHQLVSLMEEVDLEISIPTIK